MDTAEFDKMFEVEETNWWYRGRRKLVYRWIEEHHRRKGPLRMLDVACATGMSFRLLERYGSIRGVASIPGCAGGSCVAAWVRQTLMSGGFSST